LFIAIFAIRINRYIRWQGSGNLRTVTFWRKKKAFPLHNTSDFEDKSDFLHPMERKNCQNKNTCSSLYLSLKSIVGFIGTASGNLRTSHMLEKICKFVLSLVVVTNTNPYFLSHLCINTKQKLQIINLLGSLTNKNKN
jgi:hypothetical protein